MTGAAARGSSSGPGPGPWSAGVDVGGTKVDAALLDADGRVRTAVRTLTRRGVDGVVTSVVEAVERLCAGAGLEPAELACVGVGVPGMVDGASGVVSHAVNLGLDAAPVPLASLLEQRLGVEAVRVENDVNVAALGAAEVLRIEGDLAYLALGTGVAAGLILDGRLRRGHLGVAGEIGHVPWGDRSRLCPCGQRGCLELYASGSALGAAWPSGRGRPAPVELYEAAAAGDAGAVRIRDEHAEAVAMCVRVLVLTTGVRTVVLGGGVSALGTPLLDAVVGVLREAQEQSPFLRSLRLDERVLLAPREGHVAAVGAARLAQDAVVPLTVTEVPA